VSTSHGRAGATARERQWRAAGEEGCIEALPYILKTSDSLRYSCSDSQNTTLRGWKKSTL